jgi:hypothetical protein
MGAYMRGKIVSVSMKNLGLVGEERIWPGLGWFSGLMCAGSVLGAVA